MVTCPADAVPREARQPRESPHPIPSVASSTYSRPPGGWTFINSRIIYNIRSDYHKPVAFEYLLLIDTSWKFRRFLSFYNFCVCFANGKILVAIYSSLLSIRSVKDLSAFVLTQSFLKYIQRESSSLQLSTIILSRAPLDLLKYLFTIFQSTALN